jgi:hypothetical protein
MDKRLQGAPSRSILALVAARRGDQRLLLRIDDAGDSADGKVPVFNAHAMKLPPLTAL